MIDNYFEQILYRDNTNLAVNVVEELKSKQEKNKNFLNILVLLRYKVSSSVEIKELEKNIDKLDISAINKEDLRTLLNLPISIMKSVIDLELRNGKILEGIALGDSIFNKDRLKIVADKFFEDNKTQETELDENVRQYNTIYSGSTILDINYKNTKEVYDMLFSKLKTSKLLFKSNVLKIIEISYMVNPLYDRNLANEISRVENILEKKQITRNKNLSRVLKSIINRLDSVGALKRGYEIERENKTIGLENFNEFDDEKIRQNITSLTSEKDIIYNSIFYSNKLTKLNETQLHMYALNNRFERDLEKEKEIKIINLLKNVRREYYNRSTRNTELKFVECIEQYIKTGKVNPSIDWIIKSFNVEEQKLLTQEELEKINRKYNIDKEGEEVSFKNKINIFSHLDLTKIDSLNEYIEKRNKYEISATKIVRDIKGLRLEFKNKIEQEISPTEDKYLYRKESDLTSFLFLDKKRRKLTPFLFLRQKENDKIDKIYENVKDEFDKKIDKLIQDIANELSGENEVSQKNILDAEVIVYYISQAMTYEQLLYRFKNRLIERYIEIDLKDNSKDDSKKKSKDVKGFELKDKPKYIYETSIEDRKLYRRLKKELEDNGKTKYDYSVLQERKDIKKSEKKVYIRCLINETIFELLKEDKKEDSLTKKDFLEKGILEKDFLEWEKSIKIKESKENTQNKENRFFRCRFKYE